MHVRRYGLRSFRASDMGYTMKVDEKIIVFVSVGGIITALACIIFTLRGML